MCESSSSEEDVMTEEYFLTLIKKGDHVAVESYIAEKQISPEAIYDFYWPNEGFDTSYKRLCPVGLAAKCGHVQVMKTLIGAGFPVNAGRKYFDYFTPIQIACEAGRVDVVKSLVEEYDVDITYAEKRNRRPALCLAADKGNLEILQYFIEKRDISVNSRYGNNKESVLHAAAEHNQVDVCKYLISRGADVNIGNIDNQTPLILTARSSSHDSARVLFEAEADVNFADDQEETAFLNAAEYGDLDMMKLLQSHGANPELDDRFCSSPLHVAVSNNRRDIVFYLVNELNVTIEPNEYYEEAWQGETVCSVALSKCRYDLVQHLFNAGYDPSEELSEYEDSDDNNKCTVRSEDSSSASPRKKRKSFPLREDKAVLRELKQMVARPRSLLALSVLKIRRLLGRRLPVDLCHLPLPDILKNVIVSCGEKKP